MEMGESNCFKKVCRSALQPKICFMVSGFRMDVLFQYLWSICSNLWVAWNGRFIAKPVCSRGGTMVVKNLNFRFIESLKSALSRTFRSPKLSLGSWIFCCLCENFPEYPPGIHSANFNNSLPYSAAVFLI